MSQPASVRVSVRLDLSAADAFAAFTEDIGEWYKIDRFTVWDGDRALTMRFEPYVGGRLLEVYDLATGDGREHGRVSAWEPGHRLVYGDDHGTEVEVLFEPDGDGTYVTLEQRGIDRLPPGQTLHVLRYGAHQTLLRWYLDHIRRARPQPVLDH